MADMPEFIYRSGGRIKALSVHRHTDWLTGLSFRDYAYTREYIQIDVGQLLRNGFVVRPDAGQLMTNRWSGEPYIEPNSGEQLRFDEGHVSVWHPDTAYWNAWHEADLQNINTERVSQQLLFFAQAIVKIVKDI